jgi:hypothetical protein
MSGACKVKGGSQRDFAKQERSSEQIFADIQAGELSKIKGMIFGELIKRGRRFINTQKIGDLFPIK